MFGLLAPVLTLLYLVMIVDTLLGSGKNIVERQMVFNGRILLFILAMFVYYRNFSFGIPFWDSLFTVPIKNAMQLLDSFLVTLSGGQISIAPPDGYRVIFYVFIPASVVYHFILYWASYAFMDERIGRLVGIFALYLFITQGYKFGFITAILVPMVLPFYGLPYLQASIFSVPFLEDMARAISSNFSLSVGTGVIMVLFTLLIAMVFFLLGRFLFFKLAENSVTAGVIADKSAKSLAPPSLMSMANSVSFILFILFIIAFGYISWTHASPTSFFGVILMISKFMFLILVLAIFGEFMVFLSLLMFERMLRYAFR